MELDKSSPFVRLLDEHKESTYFESSDSTVTTVW